MGSPSGSLVVGAVQASTVLPLDGLAARFVGGFGGWLALVTVMFDEWSPSRSWAGLALSWSTATMKYWIGKLAGGEPSWQLSVVTGTSHTFTLGEPTRYTR